MLSRIMFLSLSLWFLILPQKVFSHKVNMFVTQVGKTLEITGFFPDGSPCKNCEIKLFDERGNLMANYKTDEEGKAKVTLPEGKLKVKVVLSAGEGHEVAKEIALEKNLSNLEKFKENKGFKDEAQSYQFGKDKGAKYEEKLSAKEGSKDIEEKLSSLRDEVSALREEVTSLRKDLQRIYFRDLLGGAGYILGLFAIIYFIKNYKKPHAS